MSMGLKSMRALDPFASLAKVKGSFKTTALATHRSVGIHYNQLETLLYDLRNGTDTRGKTPAAQLDIPQESKPHVTGFQSVNERQLAAVLSALPIPAGSTFVDIGCGKGKALFVAIRFEAIQSAVGIELAGSLCNVASENAELVKARYGCTKPIIVVEGDATAYEFVHGENIFFLNNPFDWQLMKRLLAKIYEVARNNERDTWILYGNPAHREAMQHEPKLKLFRHFKFFGPGRDIIAYKIEA